MKSKIYILLMLPFLLLVLAIVLDMLFEATYGVNSILLPDLPYSVFQKVLGWLFGLTAPLAVIGGAALAIQQKDKLRHDYVRTLFPRRIKIVLAVVVVVAGTIEIVVDLLLRNLEN
jgi:hypothetical protein